MTQVSEENILVLVHIRMMFNDEEQNDTCNGHIVYQYVSVMTVKWKYTENCTNLLSTTALDTRGRISENGDRSMQN